MQYVTVTRAPDAQRTHVGDWFDQAVCAGNKDFLRMQPVDAARRFCERCPVAATCTAYGVDTGSIDTVYGGVLMPKYPGGTRGRSYRTQPRKERP